jgi:hypothetical protein
MAGSGRARRFLTSLGEPVAQENQISGIFLTMGDGLHAPKQARRGERNRHTLDLPHGHVLGSLLILDAPG